MNDFLNRENLRASTAELIATFMFVFIGVGSVGAFSQIGGLTGPQITLIGLAHGLGIAVGIMAIDKVSGAHINPVVTLAALITGRIGLYRAALYIVAQLAGAVLAVVALDNVAFDIDNLGVHAVSSSISVGDAFVLEVILTFFLVFVIFATAMDRQKTTMFAPFAIGGVVALDHFVAIPLTGASMNPARSFGPALIHGAWDDHWVYWVAPIVGALIAAVAYIMIFGTKEDRQNAGIITLKEPEDS